MANISSANGTITLKGNWTQKAIDAFIPVLDSWEFYGEYGIQSYYSELSLKNKTTDFYGCGRWSFSGTLVSFDDWTRDWIKTNPDESHPLTAEQYDEFLKIMSDKKLKIEITFEDDEEGVGFRVEETGVFTSDGEKLYYETISCEEVEDTWETLGCETFDAAVDFFAQFVVNPNKKELQKWVKEFVLPNDCYNYVEIGEEIYDFLEDNFFDVPFVDYRSSMCDFKSRFQIDTDSYWSSMEDFASSTYGWDNFDEKFELDYLGSDEEFDEWYDILCNGEDEFDELPDYPTEEITSLDFKGKRFVLTGDFQNIKDSRDDIKQLIESKGGKCTAAISGKTNYLVIGDFGNAGESKIKKALAEKEKRDDIKIISEYDMFKFV